MSKSDRWLRWCLLIIFTFFLASACSNYFSSEPPKSGQTPPGQIASSANCQSVKHELGKTQICGQPQRMVALDPHVLDLMLSLGIEPVGYAEVDYHATANTSGQPIDQVWGIGDLLTTRPVSVGTREQPSLETILQLKPDLILKERPDSSLYPKLNQIAPTLFVKERNSNATQWSQGLLTLGRIFAREQRAQQTLAQYEQSVAQLKTQLEPVTRNSKLLLLGMAGLDNISVDTDTTFIGALLKEIGFTSLMPENLKVVNGESPRISLELLPRVDADIIVVVVWGNNTNAEIKQLWQQNPILKALPASQAERVYFLNGQLGRIRGPNAAQATLNQIQAFFRIGL